MFSSKRRSHRQALPGLRPAPARANPAPDTISARRCGPIPAFVGSVPAAVPAPCLGGPLWVFARCRPRALAGASVWVFARCRPLSASCASCALA